MRSLYEIFFKKKSNEFEDVKTLLWDDLLNENQDKRKEINKIWTDREDEEKREIN